MASPVEGAEEVLLVELNEMNDEHMQMNRGFLTLKNMDPKNLTTTYLRRLRKQIYGFDEIRGNPDLEEIDEKLRGFTEARSTRSQPSSSSRSPTPIVGLNEGWQLNLQRERAAYEKLVEDGGRPSHHLEDFDLVYSGQGHTKIIAYWVAVCQGWLGKILDQQRFCWQEFREDQDQMRSKYNTPERFRRFLEMANKYRKAKGKQGDVFWLQDYTRQSALEDWKEYQVWQLRNADSLAMELKRCEQAVRDQEVKLQAAIDDGQATHIIDGIRELNLAKEQAGQHEVEESLERMATLLEWIDEQLLILASECDGGGGGGAAAAAPTAASTEAQPGSSGDAPRHIAATRAGTKRKPADAANEGGTKRQKQVSKANYTRGQSSAAPAEIALSASSVRARPNTRSRAKAGAATTAPAPAPAAPDAVEDAVEPLAAPEAPAMLKRQRRTAAASRNTMRPQRDPQTSVPNREAPNRPVAARTGKAARKAASQQKAGGSGRPLRRSERLARKPAIHYPK